MNATSIASSSVFGNELGAQVQSVKRAWHTACRKAGITGLHIHDLRREAASRVMERINATPAEVQQFLGHANLSQTSTYVRASKLAMQRVVQKLDAMREQSGEAAAWETQIAAEFHDHSYEGPRCQVPCSF